MEKIDSGCLADASYACEILSRGGHTLQDRITCVSDLLSLVTDAYRNSGECRAGFDHLMPSEQLSIIAGWTSGRLPRVHAFPVGNDPSIL